MTKFFSSLEERKTNNSMWFEKYRPKTLDDYIASDSFKKKMKDYIDSNDPSHLLFYGRPGGGKTTLAKIIADSTDSDVLYIAASNENNVDTVRNKIQNFTMSVGFSELKIVVLDEADLVSFQGQAALRHLLELYSHTTRFILTCNYIEKIIEAVQSRCELYHIVPPSKAEVAKYIKKILDGEKIEYHVQDIVLLVNSTYPDIRKLVTTTKSKIVDGKLDVNTEEIIENDAKLKILEIIKNGDSKRDILNSVRKYISVNQIHEFNDVYRMLYESVDELSSDSGISELILAIGEGVRSDQLCLDKEINFVATLVNILNIVK